MSLRVRRESRASSLTAGASNATLRFHRQAAEAGWAVVLLSLVVGLAFLRNGSAADDPPVVPSPPQAPAPAPAEPPAPAFPKQRATDLFAALESMMIKGDYHQLEPLVWEGLDPARIAQWRAAMKHEFQQITYKEKYTTSMYDWRILTPDELAHIPTLPKTLPPAAVWAVRVDIDYRYRAKSRATGAPSPPPGTEPGAAPAAAVEGSNRDEQATVCFYLIDSGGDLRILGSDRDFFLQFGQALPRGLIGSWAIGLITAFLAMVFWVTMANHCWATRPKLRHWRWMTVALPLVGAIAYFFWVYWQRSRRPLVSMSMFQHLRASGLRAAIQADLTDTRPAAPGTVPQPPVAVSTPSPTPATQPAPKPPLAPPPASAAVVETGGTGAAKPERTGSGPA